MIKLSNNQLENLKKIELDILKEVDDICRKNDIKYSLAFGSLIGAVRHKGFIPWDDDIDIMMERRYYNRFINICSEKLNNDYFIVCFEKNKNYALPFAKVMKKNTLLEEISLSTTKAPKGIFIDIFPLDNTSSNEKERKYLYSRKDKIKKILFCKCNYCFHHSKIKLFAYRCMKIIYLPLSHNYLVNLFYKNIANHRKDNDNKYISSICGTSSMSETTWLSNDFDEYIDIPFENLNAMVAKGYKNILKQTYGDYMKLPPKEQQVPHHYVVNICFDTSNK